MIKKYTSVDAKMNVPPNSHLRGRLSTLSNKPIRKTSTHIAQGLKPSAAARVIVSIGNDKLRGLS